MKTEYLVFTVSLMVGLAFARSAAAEPYIVPSDKGGFHYSNPTQFRELKLDLAPIEQQVATAASKRCGTALAAAPLDLGNSKSLMGDLMGKAASAAIGKLVGGLLGGGGGKKQKPNLYKDPIKKKYKEKFEHPSGDAKLRVGGTVYSDGMLISAKVEKAAGKGTFHTMFLERPDCTRIWPEKYMGYGLWGKWSLSVSVTKTTKTYKNDKLVNSTTDRSGWSKSGTFDYSRGFSLWDQLAGEERKMILDADEAYLAQLRREIGNPAWREMGYAEPTEGIREAGGMFKVAPEELTNGTIAVIHITHVDDGRYKTVGFPLTFTIGDKGRMSFVQMVD